MARVEWDLSALRPLIEMMAKAAESDFKKECEQWLEGFGEEFLRIVEDEIIRRNAMDTRLLLHSFVRGGDGNVWIMSEDGMTLEVGTNIKYAKYVEDGHWTCEKGQTSRFIPGHWQGDRFVYEKGAKSGMVLKQQWVEGKHYFESAVRIMDRLMPHYLDAKLQQWIDKYFGL